MRQQGLKVWFSSKYAHLSDGGKFRPASKNIKIQVSYDKVQMMTYSSIYQGSVCWELLIPPAHNYTSTSGNIAFNNTTSTSGNIFCQNHWPSSPRPDLECHTNTPPGPALGRGLVTALSLIGPISDMPRHPIFSSGCIPQRSQPAKPHLTAFPCTVQDGRGGTGRLPSEQKHKEANHQTAVSLRAIATSWYYLSHVISRYQERLQCNKS